MSKSYSTGLPLQLSAAALALLAAGVSTPSSAAAATWTHCANEGQVCKFSGTQQVRFGANNAYAVRTATGSITCNATVFGDPAHNVLKTCDYTAVATAAPAPAPSPAPAPAPVAAPTPAPAPVAAPAPAAAVTSTGPGFYVDSKDGNDGGAGTQAQPWRTLAKVAASARLAPNAGIYLKCGSTWRETLTLNATQLQNGSVIAGYGGCSSTSKAVISGADDFTGGWSKNGNIWSVNVPQSTKITRLFINGTPQRVAQWPNFGGIGHEYRIASGSSPTSNTALSVAPADIGTLAGRDIVGATLTARTGPFFIEQRSITSYNAGNGQIGVGASTQYTMAANQGYVLSDKLWMLDAPGEFYHDVANHRLYVYPSDGGAQAALNNYSVEGTVRTNAVMISDRSSLVVSNIAAVKSQVEGFDLSNAPSAVLDSIDVSDNLASGLRIVRSSTGATVRNSTFARNGLAAVDSGGVSNVTLSNNTITDTGMVATSGNVAAVITAGPGGITTGNIIQRSGYVGVNYSGTGGSQITNNVIEDSCQRLSDGAAIYSWNGGGATANQSALIQNNIVARAPANGEGSVGGAADICMGIYADDLSRNVTIRGNSVMDVPLGINLHNTSYSTVDSNKVWLTQQSALWLNMDHRDGDVAVHNTYTNNQLHTAVRYSGSFPQQPVLAAPQVMPIMIWNAYSGRNSISASGNYFSGNQVLLLNGASMPMAMAKGPEGQANMAAGEWRKLAPNDSASSAAQFSPYNASLGGELMANGSLTSSADGWSSWFAPASTKGSAALTSQSACGGPCMLFVASTINDVVSSPGFSVGNGSLYLLKFNAAFMADGGVRPGAASASTPFTANNLSNTAGATLNYEGFFKGTSSSTSRINFGALAGTRAGLNGLSVRQITGYSLPAPREWASYAYATPRSSKVVDCAALGWSSGCSVTDANGNAVALPYTIPAGGGAKLLLLKNTALRVR